MSTATPNHSQTALEPTETYAAADAPSAVDPLGRLAVEPPVPGRYLAFDDRGVTRLLALGKPVTHVGRGFAADVVLEDQSVSRRHAIIAEHRGAAHILDDRSANGTFVNERRVSEAELRDRDVIRLGRVVLVYLEVAR
jgi:pSer/pThr/pTyr-binding forkhead associated (FHA) protein